MSLFSCFTSYILFGNLAQLAKHENTRITLEVSEQLVLPSPTTHKLFSASALLHAGQNWTSQQCDATLFGLLLLVHSKQTKKHLRVGIL